MKNFLNKIINKDFGRTNFGTKFERFTIVSPITNCINIADLKNKSRKAEFPITQATKQVNNFNDNLKNLTESGERTICKQYFNYARKVAFTLAEVLITITIVGVVALITLPNFIQKQKEQITVRKVQKAYNILSQAYLYSVQEYGPPSCWGTTARNKFSSNIIRDKLAFGLKINRKCDDPNDYSDCGLAKKYYRLGSKSANNDITGPYAKTSAIMLTNGEGVIFLANYPGESRGQGDLSNTYGLIYVDVNGIKPPNEYGKIFLFLF